GVCDFDRAKNGLLPVRVETWENFVFIHLDSPGVSLREFLGSAVGLVAPLELTKKLKFFERRRYALNCNWKVYVANYLDGGYHVPHADNGLSSVLECTKYKIKNCQRDWTHSSHTSTG